MPEVGSMIEPVLLDPATLRAYDIRGIVDESLTAAHAYTIGRAFATLVQTRTDGNAVCVGYDGRLSSPAARRCARRA